MTQTSLACSSSCVVQHNLNKSIPIVDTRSFSFVVNKLRLFFLEKGFQEVHTQNRLSIMAACEDPNTIAQYHYQGVNWPLPQTGQMWLEYELLHNPDLNGVFCVSTSYRNEPHPVAGRHHRIFPMFEFELKGDIQALQRLEEELLRYLGFGDNFPESDYEAIAQKYNTSILESSHEEQIAQEYGPVFFLKYFPERTHPFWNMKRSTAADGSLIAHKIDILMHGMETIGSAERSNDPEEQRTAFFAIEKGAYAQKLFELFGKERVLTELDDFLSQKFFVRSGGGIGITRIIRAMTLSGLITL